MTDTFIAYVAITAPPPLVWQYVYKVHGATGMSRQYDAEGNFIGVRIDRPNGYADFTYIGTPMIVTRSWDETAPNQTIYDMPLPS